MAILFYFKFNVKFLEKLAKKSPCDRGAYMILQLCSNIKKLAQNLKCSDVMNLLAKYRSLADNLSLQQTQICEV